MRPTIITDLFIDLILKVRTEIFKALEVTTLVMGF